MDDGHATLRGLPGDIIVDGRAKVKDMTTQKEEKYAQD